MPPEPSNPRMLRPFLTIIRLYDLIVIFFCSPPQLSPGRCCISFLHLTDFYSLSSCCPSWFYHHYLVVSLDLSAASCNVKRCFRLSEKVFSGYLRPSVAPAALPGPLYRSADCWMASIEDPLICVYASRYILFEIDWDVSPCCYFVLFRLLSPRSHVCGPSRSRSAIRGARRILQTRDQVNRTYRARYSASVLIYLSLYCSIVLSLLRLSCNSHVTDTFYTSRTPGYRDKP